MIRLPANLLLLFALPIILCAQLQPPDTLWTREYRDYHEFEGGAGSVLAVTDGGFVLHGNALRHGEQEQVAYIRKLDWLGNIVWTRFPGRSIYADALEIPDQSVVFCGVSSDGSRPYLLRLDTNGREVWRTDIAQPQIGGASQIAPDAEGGFVISGVHQNPEQGGIEPYMIRLDGDGNALWTQLFPAGFMHAGRMHDLARCPGGGWVLAGERRNLRDTTGTLSGGWVIRTTETGDTLWTCFLPGMICYKIHPLPDGGFALAATDSAGPLYLRLDARGNEGLRSYPFGADTTLVHTGGVGYDDGRMVYLFYNRGWYAPQRSFLAMVDGHGALQWQLGLGQEPVLNVTPCDVVETADSGLVWLNTVSYTAGQIVWNYLVRLEGTAAWVPPVAEAFSLPQCYPNPFNATTTLGFDVYHPAAFRLDVFDILGRRSRSVELGWLNYGPQRVRLTIEGLPSGRYYGRLVAGESSKMLPMTLIR